MKHLVALAAALAALLFAAVPASAHSLEEVEKMLRADEFYLEVVDRPAPDFSLHDADGRPVGLADLSGKVVVLYFIYASCPDVCPIHSDRLAAIQAKIALTPMRDLVRFVAITTDPARDTAQAMRAYGPAHGLDPANWMFLTSGPEAPEATRALAEAYGLKFTATPDGYQMHGVVTHLIDMTGRLRARYHGLKFDDANFIVHVNALTHDRH